MSRIRIENLRNPVTKEDFEGREDVTKGYIDGTKIDALIWENRISYWMPLPQPPKGE